MAGDLWSALVVRRVLVMIEKRLLSAPVCQPHDTNYEGMSLNLNMPQEDAWRLLPNSACAYLIGLL